MRIELLVSVDIGLGKGLDDVSYVTMLLVASVAILFVTLVIMTSLCACMGVAVTELFDCYLYSIRLLAVERLMMSLLSSVMVIALLMMMGLLVSILGAVADYCSCLVWLNLAIICLAAAIQTDLVLFVSLRTLLLGRRSYGIVRMLLLLGMASIESRLLSVEPITTRVLLMSDGGSRMWGDSSGSVFRSRGVMVLGSGLSGSVARLLSKVKAAFAARPLVSIDL